MNRRLCVVILVGLSWGIFALALVWPALALFWGCIIEGAAPDGGFAFSGRQLGLLWRSTWLAVVATILCLLVSLPGTFALGRLRRSLHGPFIVALLMAALLCPPMVYVFGWDRILPVGLNPYAKCIGVWALWAWPIPAMLLGAGWSRVGRGAYEAALVVTSPTSAFVRIALPALRNYLVLAGLILFVIFFGDYGVPHACILQVYATDLLGLARSFGHPMDTVWPASLSVIVICLALLAIWVTSRECIEDDDGGGFPQETSIESRGPALILLCCFAVSWLLPVGALVIELASPAVMAEAFVIYGDELAWSLSLAGLSGVLGVGMGMGIVATSRLRTMGLVWAVMFGALPGALIGESLIAAYNHQVTSWVYDYWPIVVLCYVARFGWIGVLTAYVAARSSGVTLLEQARTDGASDVAFWGRIQIPMSIGVLLGGAGVIAALCVADVAASSMVRVPGFTPIAHILFEKFHRFEDGMLISLSLWLVAASWVAAAVLSLVWRRQPTA